jgi:hypothetical protein
VRSQQRKYFFNYLENRKTYGEYVIDTRCVHRFLYKFYFEKFFALVNIWRVTFEMRAEAHVGPNVKCALLSSECNQHRNASTFYQISTLSLMTIVLAIIELLHADRQEEKHGKKNKRFSNFQF